MAYKLYGKKNTVPTTIMAPQPSGRVVRFVNAQAEEVRIEGNVPACEEMRINTRPHTMRQDEENESTSDQPGVTVSLGKFSYHEERSTIIQWTRSITDTLGPKERLLYRGYH